MIVSNVSHWQVKAANQASGTHETPIEDFVSNRIDQLAQQFDMPLELMGVMRIVYKAGLIDAQIPLGVLARSGEV